MRSQVFDGSVDAAIEESIVDTHIEHAGRLPLQVGVGVLRSGKGAIGGCYAIFVGVIEISAGTVSGHGRISAEAQGVTANAITHTQLQVGEQVLVLHEGLLGDVACGAN